MVARGHSVFYTFREYVAHEAASNTKHEYLDGQIHAMAGGTPEHSALIAAVATHLSNAVRGGPCRVHTSDLRVRVERSGLATHPDVSVLRGKWARDPEDPQTVTNPTVLVEVLSPSTEAYDRGEKLEHYKTIPSLRACLLVAHDRREVELWARDEGGAWTRSLVGVGGAVDLPVISARLVVDDLYADAAEP